MKTTRTFTDLDFGFNINPVKKNLILSNDEHAILRALRNIVVTNHYEIPFQSKLGSNIRQLLFQPVNDFTAEIIKREIEDVIKNFEPRVNLIKIETIAILEQNSYKIYIYFTIINSSKPLVLDFILKRLR